MRLLLDIETNGLLPELTKVHSLVLRDRDTGALVASCADQAGCESIQRGLEIARGAEVLYAHNGVAFDFPALEKVYGESFPGVRKVDTLVAVRLAFSNQAEYDYNEFNRGRLPGHLIGRHSLEAWGHRLGVHKGEYTQGWDRWTPEMQRYCEQDTEVLRHICNHLGRFSWTFSPEALAVETALAEYLFHQEQNGWPFDEAKAQALYAELSARREHLRNSLIALFGTWEEPDGPPKIAKRDDPARGRVKGQPYQKVKRLQFNPSSRDHIAKSLKRLYGWEPGEFTETGKPKIDETTLEGLTYPAVEDIKEYLLLEKRLGQLAEGDQAWLKLVRAGKIHHRVNPLGAITHRATHSGPNVSQVPAVTAPHGDRCRELFDVPPGWRQMGADASGLELRCLAHYMAKYDGGAYARILLEEDIHTANQMALGEFVPPGKEGRNLTKTWAYALLYGAGDAKLGRILKPELAPDQREKIGKASRTTFLRNTPALKYLLADVEAAVKARGRFTVLDGRTVYVRHAHAALNTLLQSTGAVICKHWIVAFDAAMRREYGAQGWQGQWAALGWIHDEIQVAVRPAVADAACRIAVASIESLTARFSFRCPLTGEAKLGANWRDTH